jgi:hypothetical protein
VKVAVAVAVGVAVGVNVAVAVGVGVGVGDAVGVGPAETEKLAMPVAQFPAELSLINSLHAQNVVPSDGSMEVPL